jgi:hypothetical protein
MEATPFLAIHQGIWFEGGLGFWPKWESRNEEFLGVSRSPEGVFLAFDRLYTNGNPQKQNRGLQSPEGVAI